MQRKVIRQGNNTLTITLPRKWTQKFGINAGDDISVEEVERGLFISTNKETPLNSLHISLQGLNQPLIWRYLVGAYRSGYDAIEVDFDPHTIYENLFTSLADFNKKLEMSSQEVIQDVVNRLPGVEIIDQKRDSCIIKDLGEITDREFDNALRRIFLLIEGMGEDCLQLLKEKNQSLLRTIDITDTNIDRFSDYCFRVLNKKGYKHLKKTSSIYSILLLLEYVGDEYKKAARHIANLKRTEKLLPLFEEIHQLFSLFETLFYSFERKKMLLLYERTEKLRRKIKENTLSKEENEVLHHLKKVVRFITDLLQLRIDLEV